MILLFAAGLRVLQRCDHFHLQTAVSTLKAVVTKELHAGPGKIKVIIEMCAGYSFLIVSVSL